MRIWPLLALPVFALSASVSATTLVGFVTPGHSGTIYIPIEFAKYYALEVKLDKPADYLSAELSWDIVSDNYENGRWTGGDLYPGSTLYHSINYSSLFTHVKTPDLSYWSEPSYYGYTVNFYTRLTLSAYIDGYSSNIPINYSISITDITPTPVPEPATWAMLIVGFGVIGGLSRSRRVRTTFIHI